MADIINGVAFLGKSIGYSLPVYGIWLLMSIVIYGVDILVEKYFFMKEFIFLTYVLSLGFITATLNFAAWNIEFKSFSYNFVPFINGSFEQACLNFIIFIPMGVLLPMIIKQINKWKWVFVSSIVVSFSIEVIQTLFIGRSGDIDDVIMNTLGCLTGYGIKIAAGYFFVKYAKTKTGIGTLSVFFNVAAFFWGFIYKGLSLGEIILYNFGFKSCFNIMGIHYSELLTIILAIVALLICRKYPNEFLTKSGKIIAVFNICLGMINMFM